MRPIKFNKREIAVFAVGTAIALASLPLSGDPVVSVLLVVAWVAFAYLAYHHEGSRTKRIGFFMVVSVVFIVLFYRQWNIPREQLLAPWIGLNDLSVRSFDEGVPIGIDVFLYVRSLSNPKEMPSGSIYHLNLLITTPNTVSPNGGYRSCLVANLDDISEWNNRDGLTKRLRILKFRRDETFLEMRGASRDAQWYGLALLRRSGKHLQITETVSGYIPNLPFWPKNVRLGETVTLAARESNSPAPISDPLPKLTDEVLVKSGIPVGDTDENCNDFFIQ